MESSETKPKKPRIEAEEVRPAKDTRSTEHVNLERLNRILASADQKTAESDEEDEEEAVDGQFDDGDLRPEFVEGLASQKVDLVSFLPLTHIFFHCF